MVLPQRYPCRDFQPCLSHSLQPVCRLQVPLTHLHRPGVWECRARAPGAFSSCSSPLLPCCPLAASSIRNTFPLPPPLPEGPHISPAWSRCPVLLLACCGVGHIPLLPGLTLCLWVTGTASARKRPKSTPPRLWQRLGPDSRFD